MSLKKFHVKRQTDQYYWSENEEYVTIHVGVKNMPLKYIDIFISDVYVKVNIPKIKFIMVFDLKHRIIINHLKNRTTLANNQIDIRLVKQEQGQTWNNLEFTGTREEKRERRQLSIRRFEEYDKQKDKQQDETKLTLDKAALDKQMEIEEYERRYIKDKKEEEKRIIEDKLYEDLEQIEQLNSKIKQGYDTKLIQQEADKIAQQSIDRIDPTINDSNKVEEINENVIEDQKNDASIEDKPKQKFNSFNDPSKDIFSDQD